ncbi:AraC-like DNA-binding protein [Bradyrhizobium sp. LB7.2]
MTDPISEAAEELRHYVISNGFSLELLADIANEFGVSEQALRTRFKRAYGKDPGEVDQRAPVAAVGMNSVIQKAKEFAKGSTYETRSWVGRRFIYRGEPYIFSYASRVRAYAFRVATGRGYSFSYQVWKNEIEHQLKLPTAPGGQSDPDLLDLSDARQVAAAFADKNEPDLKHRGLVGSTFTHDGHQWVFAGFVRNRAWAVRLKGGGVYGLSHAAWDGLLPKLTTSFDEGTSA